MRIKSVAKQTIEKHNTNDPLHIAQSKQIIILYEEFRNIWGYCNTSKRVAMIHINQNLPDELKRFVIAHELGHRILHPDVNVPFLRANTLLSSDKIEREANQFAVELLIPDQLLLDGLTIYEAAAACGVPPDIAHLKKTPKQIFWKDETSYISL